jgi:hypothetical protein
MTVKCMARWISDYSKRNDCRQFHLVFAYYAFSQYRMGSSKADEKQKKKNANDSDDDDSDSGHTLK